MGLLILGAVGATYLRIFIFKDYIVTAEATCDPEEEVCFVGRCIPEEEGSCTGDPETDIWYFKTVSRKAANIPLCDPNEETCEALVCPEGEDDCEETLCDLDNQDGIECSDPEVFAAEAADEESEEAEAVEDETATVEDETGLEASDDEADDQAADVCEPDEDGQISEDCDDTEELDSEDAAIDVEGDILDTQVSEDV